MEKKYGDNKVKVTAYRDVKVGDEYLEEKIDTEVRIYGNVKVSKEANEVLKMPPKFATLKEVENGMAKFRMHIRNENESEPDEKEDPTELFEPKSNAIDLTNLRVAELPFCKRIYIPDQIDTKTEI